MEKRLLTNLQVVFQVFSRRKRDRLIYLFCYLSSLDSSQSEGFCTPSNSTLSEVIEGNPSRSTVKRYLSILEELGLIIRTYPNPREHIIVFTERGLNAFKSRCQNPRYDKARRKNEPLNKTINNIFNKTNYQDSYSQYPEVSVRVEVKKMNNEKPEIKKIHLIYLEQSLKKVCDDESNIEKLKQQVLYSITSGRLMCISGTGTYHQVPDAINIAMHLIKNGQWKAPHGFNEHEGEKMGHIEQNTKPLIRCSVCRKTEGVKRIYTHKKGVIQICPEHYAMCFEKLEGGEIYADLKQELGDVFGEQTNGNQFNWEYFLMVRNKEEEKLRKIVGSDLHLAYAMTYHAVENFFRFKREENGR